MRVVAVDVGTSAVRAAVIEADGRVLSSSAVRRSSGLGGSLFDASKLLESVVDVLARLDGCGKPSALAISSHIGAVAVDDRLRPVDLAGGWADSRGRQELAALDPEVAAETLQAAGRPSVTGGALAYLLSRSSASARRIHAVLSPKDFLVAHLTGRIATDTINAAYTLAFDIHARTWNRALLEKIGVDASVLPVCVEPTALVGELHAGAATETGLPAGLPVVAGGPDGSVGSSLLLGTSEELIADVGGTTDVVGMLLPTGTKPPTGAIVNPAILPERLVAGGASGMTGGAVARWRELVGDTDDERLAEIQPGSDGLVVLPAMTGERFPRWRDDSRGAVLGQRPDHGSAHLLRAAQEAAAFTLREGLDVLDPAGTRPVAFAGGSARSASVAQLRADVLDRPIMVAKNPDVTLLGTALIAFLGVGLAGGLEELRGNLLGELRELVPDPVSRRRYSHLYVDWLRLRDAVASVESRRYSRS